MAYKLFIQTNADQYVGALVAAYAAKRNSRNGDSFDVEILHADDYPWLAARDGQKFLRGLEHRVWHYADLQSFTPTRFLPPKLMGYEGRALVIDPDCFAVGDIWELFSRDMQGHAVLCCLRPALKEMPPYRASSVMLLDNAKLRHWDPERNFAELFDFKRDYLKWVKLEMEPEGSVGILEPEWNDFDRLTPATKILHNTYRRTQPWKTGLPIGFTIRQKPGGLARNMLRAIKHWSADKTADRYQPHPDPNQERFFFGLLAEMLDKGLIDEALLRREIAAGHVRQDAFDLCRRAAA